MQLGRNILGSFILLVSLGFVCSCSYNRPPEPLPEASPSQRTLSPTHTIAQLKTLYKLGGVRLEDDIVVEAVVSSDDKEGNLYKTCYLQDNTGGIELKIAMANMSSIYPQGTKVYLKAKGLTLGSYAGQVNLGYRSLEEKYETAYLPEKLVPSTLIASSREAFEPIDLTITTLAPRYAGMLIRLKDVQFRDSELGKTYADPINKNTNRNINRTLVDKNKKSIIVRTSSYARFAGVELPRGSGDIIAILGYFNSTPQLLLLREGDARFDKPRF